MSMDAKDFKVGIVGAGLTEPPQMPLDETVYIMELMDGLRKDWDVHYPMDEIDWK